MNAVDEFGDTPLHDAAANDIRLLSAIAFVSRGGDVRRLNNQGQTPLDVARAEGAVAERMAIFLCSVEDALPAD